MPSGRSRKRAWSAPTGATSPSSTERGWRTARASATRSFGTSTTGSWATRREHETPNGVVDLDPSSPIRPEHPLDRLGEPGQEGAGRAGVPGEADAAAGAHPK